MGEGVGEGVGAAVTCGVGYGEGACVGSRVGAGVGLGVGPGVGLGVGEGVGAGHVSTVPGMATKPSSPLLRSHRLGFSLCGSPRLDLAAKMKGAPPRTGPIAHILSCA